MVLSLEDAVTILNKWKEDSAHILVVSESPFQQSRRGILEQRLDWAIGLQGKVSKVAVDHGKKGEKTGTVVLEGSCGHLSLSMAVAPLCTKNRVKPSRLCAKKPSLRQIRRSLSSFPRTESSCSMN